MTTAPHRERFDRELGRLLGAARRRVLLHGALSIAAAAGALVGAAAWMLGAVEAPPPTVRLGLLICGLALLVAVAWVRLVAPWRRLRDRAALARALEAQGGLDNLVIAAEEAARLPHRWGGGEGAAAVLVDRLFAAAAGQVAAMRLGRRLRLPGAWLALLGLAGIAGLLLWGAVAAPGRLTTGAARLLRPLRDETAVPGAGLYLTDGPREAVAGSDVSISVHDFGRAQAPVDCEVRVGSGLWQAVPCARTRSGGGAPGAIWSATLAGVRESFAYRFGRAGHTTPEGIVVVRRPPLLSAWGATIRPPAYTRLPAQVMSQLPARLQAPVGSRLNWLGLAAGGTGGEAVRAAVITATGDTLALAARGDTLRGSVRLAASLAYTVRLRDARGLENAPRVTYVVDALPDAPPVITLARPGDDGRLPPAGTVDLQAGASDDYGVARIELLLRRERAEDAPAGGVDAQAWSRVGVWPPVGGDPAGAAPPARALVTPWGTATVTPGALGGTPPTGPLTFDLRLEAGALDLASGDVVAICLEASDNREPGPSGRARSAIVRLALPSAAELLAAQADEGRERLDTLEQLRRRGDDVTKELEKLERELRQDQQPGWERKQQLQAALERQRALQEEFQRTAQALQEDLGRLEQANLNSVELVEKMREVASLLAQVRNEALDRLLEQLRDQAARLSPDQVKAAMEEVARNQQEYRERLDRAIGLLKELAREQQMEGLTAVVEKLLREQQALRDAARADSAGTHPPGGKPDAGEQAQRQRALADETDRLAERVREALDRLQKEPGAAESPTGEAMRKALEEALKQLAAQHPEQKMQEAARRLATPSPPSPAGPQPSAPPQEPQEQALRDLAALYHVLLRGQMQMQGAMQQYAATNLRRLAADLLALSQREEEIAGLVPAELRGVAVGDLARRQNRVLKAARGVRDRLQEVGTHSPALSEQLIRELDAVVAGLNSIVSGLEQGIGGAARRESRDSVGQMNRFVIGLLTAAQQAGSGGGGGTTPLPSEQLQRMAQEQAGLNALGQQLQRQLQQQGLSPEARAQMQRLQSDQSGLAGRAQDLAQRERGRPAGERVLGDLDQVGRDMERVADDLGAGRVDDETLARQERILSRLLDAHNSVRKRDFTQKRESRSARVPFAPQVGEGGPAAAARDPAAFLRTREPVEKAPADYRDLVRRYYRALERLFTPDAPPPARRTP